MQLAQGHLHSNCYRLIVFTNIAVVCVLKTLTDKGGLLALAPRQGSTPAPHLKISDDSYIQMIDLNILCIIFAGNIPPTSGGAVSELDYQGTVATKL